jgi:hypothetical protein
MRTITQADARTEREPAPRNRFWSFLSCLFDGYWPTEDHLDESPDLIRSPQRVYARQNLLADGDVADLYLACDAGAEAAPCYLLKIVRDAEGRPLLDNERTALAHLRAAAGETTYGRYLPVLVDSFVLAGRSAKRVNVFRYEPGLLTLEAVHRQHPALDSRHLAWIFNRLLTVLGFIHRQSRRHGAILPCHVLVDAAGHGLQLVGWGHSIAQGQRIRTVPAQYEDWYPPEVWRKRTALPATDLFLAARCIVYLAGGDPVSQQMPEVVPLPLQRFLQSCLLEGVRMRPNDAWALQEEWEQLLRRLYGPPCFHELTLT